MANAAIFKEAADHEARLLPSDGKKKPVRRRPGEQTLEDITTGPHESEETPLLSAGLGADGVHEGSFQRQHPEDGPEDDPEDGPQWPGQADFDGFPWYKMPSIRWMLPPFLIFALAFGGTIVPKINLLTDIICQGYLAEQDALHPGAVPALPGGQDDQCRIAAVQSRVSVFTLAGNLITGLLAAAVAPKLGTLSDRYGRCKIIVCTSLGMLVSEVLFIIVATDPENISYMWLIIGYALDGISGSFFTGMAIAHAYAADCTPPSKRNVAFGYFHGCLFLGIAFGPILAGGIIKMTGYLLSIFYVALGAHVLFILALLFLVPESLSARRQMAAREKHAKTAALNSQNMTPANLRFRALNIFEPLRILWPRGEGSTPALRRNLALLAAIDTTCFGVAMGAMTVIVIYTRYQFGWKTFESSVFVSIINISRVTCLMIIIPLVSRLVRGPVSPHSPQTQPQRGADALDLGIIRIGILFDVLGYLGYMLARTPVMFTLAGVVASVGGVASPTLQSALTKHVPPDRTGQLLGASGTLHGLARVVAPTIFHAIYAGTVGKFTQTVFLCLTVCFVIAGLMSLSARPNVYLDDKEAPTPGLSEGAVNGEVGRAGAL